MIPALIATMLIVAAPAVEVSATVENLPIEIEAWKKLPQVKLTVDERGKSATYTGIPLAHFLKAQLPGKAGMAELRGLSDAVLVVGASDGYQAVFSAAEVAMDPKGERYLFALEQDGKPLDEKQGPARLVVSSDPQHVRWVRMINSVQLIRLKTRKMQS
ncbi:molybdopterin-dependent oxidoreductase [Singulisphaera sp. PoT]|uniref:molybdopterin-dependent oxidoreductase n=1 Tax=Singulisphaera sp. PoT TaxID=3411797 RepID=UPI003BF4E1D0